MSHHSIGAHGRHRGARRHLLAWPSQHRAAALVAEPEQNALVETAPPTADLRAAEAPTAVHPYVIADTDDAIEALAATIAEANLHADPIDIDLLGLPRYLATTLARTWGTGRAAA